MLQTACQVLFACGQIRVYTKGITFTLGGPGRAKGMEISVVVGSLRARP